MAATNVSENKRFTEDAAFVRFSWDADGKLLHRSSGSPGTFTAEQVTYILAVACESPELSGRPIACWTHRELAAEVVLRGIVPSISVSQIGRYLVQAQLQPHRSKYWLNAKEKDPEVFEQQVQIVCQTVPLDLHGTSGHRRNGQTLRDVEGKLGKPPNK